jgi:glucose-6-phosphate 1-dehydrogenase
LFGTVAEGLAKSGCAENARVVVKKPFGRDLASAQELNRILHRYFPRRNSLPHRSFSGKGTGTEHSLYSLRESNV